MSDIEHYVFFCNVLNLDYAALYFLMRATDLRAADEKKQGLFGTLFYVATKDAVAKEMEETAWRFRQESVFAEKLKAEKVPSPTIMGWYKEQIQYKIKPFASSRECLEEMRENALFQEEVGERNGFKLHEDFARSVAQEVLLRGLAPPAGPARVSLPSHQPLEGLLARPEPVRDILLMTGETQAGPYHADEVWQFYLDGQIEADSFFWKEGMSEWCPIEQFVQPSATS